MIGESVDLDLLYLSLKWIQESLEGDGDSKLKWVSNGGQIELGEMLNIGEDGVYLYPPRISSRWGKLWTGLSGQIWTGLSDPPRKTAKDQNWSQWHVYSIRAGYFPK